MDMRLYNVLAFSVEGGWQLDALGVVILFIMVISMIQSQNAWQTRSRKAG
jgi:hypothetical protein